MLSTSSRAEPHRSSIELTRLGLHALQLATTAGELRHALESMRALPGMSWPRLPLNEGLLAAAAEQRELARLHDVDLDTGLANRRRLSRALREANPAFGPIALLIVRLPEASDLRRLVRAAHLCAVTLRPGDLAARLGTRRLGVLLQSISHASALTVAARLRADLVASQPSASDAGLSVRVITRQHSRSSPTP
jgi:GGDEF domain-containing protein